MEFNGNKLKELRTRKKMTLKEFSKILEINPNSLASYERGVSTPSIKTLMTVSKKCNVSMDWLCGLDEENNSTFIAPAFKKIAEAIELLGFEIDIEKEDLNDPFFEFNINLKLNGLAPYGAKKDDIKIDNFLLSTDLSINEVRQLSNYVLFEFFSQLKQMIEIKKTTNLPTEVYKMWLNDFLENVCLTSIPTKEDLNDPYLFYNS